MFRFHLSLLHSLLTIFVRKGLLYPRQVIMLAKSILFTMANATLQQQQQKVPVGQTKGVNCGKDHVIVHTIKPQSFVHSDQKTEQNIVN